MEKVIGPITSREEFFNQLDLSRPELAGMSEALAAGNIAVCEKLFADAMRKNPLVDHYMEQRKNNIGKMSDAQKDAIIKQTKETMDYSFVSCGIKHTFEKGKIDWTYNPTYNNYPEWVWQFSRHGELGPLASYHFLTGDDEAVRVYMDVLGSWIEQALCPLGQPGGASWNWRTIEAGIRMMGWASHFNYMITSPLMTDKFICDFYTSYYEHGERLRNDYTTFNWLIMEMHGLAKIALNAPFFKKSGEWFDFAMKTLTEQLDVQLYPDGFQCELSTNYHQVVDQNYTNIFDFLRQMGRDVPADLKANLARAFEVYMKLCRPCRKTPDINDGAQVNVVGNMQRALCHYPEREDFRWFATDGMQGTPPDFLCCGMEYSGAVTMRSGWERDAVWAYMDASPFGIGHQHEDKLNVLLDAYGKTLLTEAGCYAYDSSDMRKYGLASRGHNTVMLGGKEQNRMKLYNRADLDIKKRADLSFSDAAGYAVAISTYDEGYGAELENMTHQRKLIFIKDSKKYGLKPFFIVIDRFEAPDDTERKYEQMWHMEDCQYEQGKSFAKGGFGDGVGLMIATADTQAEFVNMKGQHEPYYQGFMPILPAGPHEHRPINTPVLVGKFAGKRRVVTVLYPYNEGKNALVCVEASTEFDALDLTLNTENGKFTLNEKDFA